MSNTIDSTAEPPGADASDGARPEGAASGDDRPGVPRTRRRGRRRVRRWLPRVALVLVALLVAGTVVLLTTRVPMVPESAAYRLPARPVIDQTGDWPDAPVNSQYGTITARYHCTVEAGGLIDVLDADVPISMTGIFPLRAAAGQPFFITDGKGQAVLPASVVNRLRGLGVRQVQGELSTLEILARGATPDVWNVAATPQPVGPAPLLADTPLVVPMPGSGAFTIGPFRAGGPTSEIGIGAVHTRLTAVFAHGIRLPLPVSLDCPAPAPTNLVALITIGGPPDGTPIRIAGALQPATVPDNSGLLGAIIPYPCTFDGFGTFTVPTNVNAFIQQLYVHTGQTWSLLNGHGYVTVPAELTTALLAAHPDAVSTDVELTRLGTIAQNSEPVDQNYLAGPTPGDTVQLRRDAQTVVHFPAHGMLLPPERFTAGRPGTTRVWLGDSAGTLTLRGAMGTPVAAPISFRCPTIRPLMPLLPFVVAGPGEG